MKIFFRYLFMRLAQTFLICLAACTLIWVMADLYGNMDDFLDHKVNLLLVVRFYLLQIPKMLVQVLPAAVLFSILFTLLSLNRRSELVALQSGGMTPIWMFSPFLLFAFLWMVILAYDLSGPAAQSQVTRERLLKQVKGQAVGRDVFPCLQYVDKVNRLVWTFERLDIKTGRAKNMTILQRDARGHEMVSYFAQTGTWTGDFWRLQNLKKIVYGVDGGILEQKLYPELDLPDVTTPPQQLSLIVSQPEQLTLGQLSQYIDTSSQSQESLARYRTEWWNRIFYPFGILVLALFSLLQGARSDRRSAIAGVGMAIVVLLAYTMAMSIFMAMGHSGRLPPFLAAIATEAVFGVLGLHLLAVNNGWWWQLHEWWKKWYGEEEEEAA